LKKYGLDPIKDVILLALDNIPERVQALLTGAVDAVDLEPSG
jgi:ABC-type nitrate/sulfonate/bicarbonate transport system substrate-binding protein